MRHHARLAVLCLALGSTTVAARQAPPAWPEVARFHRDGVAQHAVVGSSLALIRDGRIVAREDVGLRDRETARPIDAQTIFHWASITKTFTAVAIMQLRNRGLLRLDDAVVKYVPELAQATNPHAPLHAVTIRHLLSHSAGFRESTWPWATGAAWEPFEPPGWAQLVGMMPYTRVEFLPGSKYAYSNPGYVFLGRVIEAIVQEPFETYVDKEILRPLGMTRAFFDRAPTMLRDQRSHSYIATDAGLREARFDFDTGITVANGGLNAPVEDMAKYAGFLMGSADAPTAARYETVLTRATIEEMWRPAVAVDTDVQMGLGFFLERRGGMDLVAHSGGQNGFISLLVVHAPSRTAAIMAFNTHTTSEKEGMRRNTRALAAALRDVLIDRVLRPGAVHE